MKEIETHHIIPRDEWSNLGHDTSIKMTFEELENLRGLNDPISLGDVKEIYVPLVQLINLFIQQYEKLQQEKTFFLEHQAEKKPFVIGIAGSVAVGKSTTARLLTQMLASLFSELSVEMITTDGFLHPNKILKEKGIMNRKGFPESYNMKKLINFLSKVKTGETDIPSPVYSHEVYDIVEGKTNILHKPDILIVEGINVLQSPSNEQIYISDFFDFSIYVDAEPEQIEKWYLERFGVLLDTAFTTPDNYYYELAQKGPEVAFAHAHEVWETVNLENLKNYILPTRKRADLILHKSEQHFIDEVRLKKY